MSGFTLTANLKVTLPGDLNSIINQLNSRLQGVNVNVGLKLPSGANQQINQLNSNLSSLGKQATKTGLDFEKMGSNVALSIKKFAGFTIVASAFYTVSRAISGSIDDAIKFQHELVKIRQVTGTSLKDLTALSDEVTTLSKRFGVSSTKLLEAAQTLSQAGLSATQTKTALEALAKTDISPTFDNMGNTTEGLIAIMAQFGAQAEDLEGILGSINTVAAKFAVESSDIVTAVRRTGGAFEAAGGSLNELMALFTSVRATTRESAESIATGFRTIFTRIQRTRTIGFLEDLGIQLRDVEGKFIGPYKAIQQLSTALSDLETTDPRFSSIIEELGGFRQVSKVIPLIKEFTTAQQALLVAQRGSTSLASDAEKAQASLAIRITKVKEEFQELIRSIGNDGNVQAFIDITLKLSSALIKLADNLRPLLPLIATVGGLGLGKVIGGAFRSFAGVKPTGFNKGGLVPGSGSGDTVPAMLEPGEFVLRKDAVKALGVNNIQMANKGGMIRRKYNFGTGVKPLSQKELTLQLNSIVSDTKNGGRDSLVAALGAGSRTTDAELVAQALTRANDPQISGVMNAFSAARAGRAIAKEASTLTPEENNARANQIVPPDKRTFGGVFLKLGFDKNQRQETGVSDKEGFTSVIGPDKRKVQIPYTLKNAILPESHALNLTDAIFKPKLKQTITSGAESLKGFFGASTLNPIHIANEASILGGLFESSLLALGAPYQAKPDDYRGFDFPLGLGSLAGKFGADSSILVDKPTDAKLTYGESNRSNIREKINSYYQDYANKAPIRKADGGNTTDTVPALLTPGEFVVNKDAARAIGLSELHRMNKADKVQGFAKGGSVRKYAGGGGVSNFLNAGLGLATALPLIQSITGVTDANKTLIQSISSTAAQFVGFRFLIGELKNQIEDRFPGSSLSSRISAGQSNIESLSANVPGFVANANEQQVAQENAERERDRLRRVRSLSNIRAGVEERRASTLANESQILTNAANNPNFNATAAQRQAIRQRAADKAQQAVLFSTAAQERRESADALRPQITAQDDLAQKSATKLAFIRNEEKANNDKLAQEKKNVASLQTLNTALNIAEGGAILLGAAASSIGQQLTQSGLAQIKAGNIEGGKTALSRGGLLSGGGQGLAVGAGVGGTLAQVASAIPHPIVKGIVFGLSAAAPLLGSALGGYFGQSAAEKLANELERVSIFDNAIKPFERALTSVSSGKTLARTQAFTVASGTNLLQRNLENASLEGKESAQGKIANSILQLDTFLQKLAEQSKSIDEFSQAAGSTLTNFAIFQGLPLAEVKQRFIDQIATQGKANEIQSRLAQAQGRELERLNEFNKLSSVLKDAIISLETFTVSLDSLESFAGGGSGSTKFIDRSEVFGRLGQVSNASQFKNIVEQTAGLGFGAGSEELTKELFQASEAMSDFPNLIKRVVAVVPNDGEALLERVKDELTGVPDFVKQTILANVTEKLGPERKPEKFVSEARDNAAGLAEDLQKGTFKVIADAFAETSKLQTDHNNKIAAIYEKYRAIEGKRLVQEQRITESKFSQEDFTNSLTNKQLTLGDAQRRDSSRARTFGNFAGVGDAGKKLSDLIISIKKNEEKLQVTTEVTARNELLQKLADERNALDKVNGYLDYMGDASKRNGDLLKAQEKFIKERETRKGIAQDFLFGDNEDKARIIRGAAGAKTLAQSGGDLSALPEFAKADTISFLRSLGDTVLPFLGKSGNQIIDETVAKSGAGSGLTKDNLGLVPSPGEIQITTAIEKNFEQERTAAAARLTALERIETAIKEQAKFAAEGIEVEEQNQKNDIDRGKLKTEGSNISSQIEGLGQQAAAIAEIEKLVSGTGAKGADVFNNRDALQKISENRQRDLNKDTKLQTSISQTTLGSNQDIKVGLAGILGDQKLVDSVSLDNKIGIEEKVQLFDSLKKRFGEKAGQDIAANFAAGSAPDKDGSFTLKNFAAGLNSAIASSNNKNKEQLANEKIEASNLQKELGATDAGFGKILTILPEIQKQSKAIEKFDSKAITDEIAKLDTNLEGLVNKFLEVPTNLKIPGKADGGLISGKGNKDDHLIRTTPGEFVMQKEAVSAYGLDTMRKMNNLQYFRDGGLAKKPKKKLNLYQEQAKEKNELLSFLGAKGVTTYFDRRGGLLGDFVDINKQTPLEILRKAKEEHLKKEAEKQAKELETDPELVFFRETTPSSITKPPELTGKAKYIQGLKDSAARKASVHAASKSRNIQRAKDLSESHRDLSLESNKESLDYQDMVEKAKYERNKYTPSALGDIYSRSRTSKQRFDNNRINPKSDFQSGFEGLAEREEGGKVFNEKEFKFERQDTVIRPGQGYRSYFPEDELANKVFGKKQGFESSFRNRFIPKQVSLSNPSLEELTPDKPNFKAIKDRLVGGLNYGLGVIKDHTVYDPDFIAYDASEGLLSRSLVPADGFKSSQGNINSLNPLQKIIGSHKFREYLKNKSGIVNPYRIEDEEQKSKVINGLNSVLGIGRKKNVEPDVFDIVSEQEKRATSIFGPADPTDEQTRILRNKMLDARGRNIEKANSQEARDFSTQFNQELDDRIEKKLNPSINFMSSDSPDIQRKKIRGFAEGGVVPGLGNTDSIPAMLTPGEFVMNKNAVEKIGVDKLAKANKQGRAKFHDGGLAANGIRANSGGDSSELKTVFDGFNASVNKLAEVATNLTKIPSTISMTVRHTVEVVFNGAEVLSTLQPALQDLAIKTAGTQINRMIADKFPDAGPVQNV